MCASRDPAREEWEVCPCGWRPELGKHYAKADHVQWWREQIKERGSLEASTVRFVSASASTAIGTWDDAPRSELQWKRRSPRSPSPFFVTVLASNSLNPTCKLKQHCASFVNRRWSMMVLSQGTGTCAKSPPQLIGSIIGFASVPAHLQTMQISLALNTLTSPRQLGEL